MSPRKFTGVFIDRNSCFKKKAHVPVYRDFPFGCGLNAPLLSSQDVIAARKKARAAAAALTENEVTIPSQKINSLPPIQGPKPFHSSPNVGTDLRVQKGKFRVAGKPHGVSSSCTSPQSGNGFRVKKAAGKLKLLYVKRSTQVPGQESRVDDARSWLPSTQKKHNMAVQSRAPATQHNVLVNSAASSRKIVVPPSIRVKVKQALRSFQFLRTKYLQVEQARLKGPVGGSSSHLRADTMAAKTLRNNGMYVNTGDQIIGVVPGVEVGDHFHYRIELCIVGLHRQIQAGIDFLKSRKIATSIVVSGGCYEDDIDEGEVLEYTGHGGNNYSGNKKQSTDQKLERGNLALANSYSRRIPVRVIRGFRERNIGRINVQSTYTYDGLYDVERYWVEAGQSGFKVYKFRLRRQPNQPKLASGTVTFLGKKSEISYKKSLVMEDLARGKENVRIKVYNDVDNDRPPRFEYAKSIKYPPSLKPKQHKGCSCRDGCDDPTKCRCARKNGGEFPYNYDGALVLIKNLVYECGPDCSCPSNCPNRISQHGIQLSLQLFKTEKKGWGVRSPESIPAGSFICEYVGDILTNDEPGRHVGTDEYLFDIGRGNDVHEHSLWTDGFSELLVSEGLCQRKNVTGGGMNSVEDAGFTVDAARRGNIGRLLNHSCSPNLDAQNVLFDHDDRRLPHVMFFAVENIPPMVELCYRYNCPVNQVVNPTGTVREKPCYCGSSDCKRRLY